MRKRFENLKFEDLRLHSTMFRYVVIFICHLSFVNFSSAQPKNISSSEILHRIQGLKNTATVLYIAAHPDDENTRLISYLEKDKHYRVAYLSLTRGEGGQNLIGTEQGMDLGILRTQELLAARKIDGGEQFFSTAYDFGYSKTPEETLKKWDEKKVLGDIITVMNHLQPDIVICRFPTTGEGGHGHHTASAILAEKAFDSLVKANGTYVPKKLFWNTFSFGSNNTTSEDQLKIDVGGYNALLGKSYGEIAAEARSMHRCQAFGTERRRGEQFEYFKTLRGDQPKSELMENIKTDWSRFKGGDAINKKIDEIIKKFDMNDPSKSVKSLMELQNLLYPGKKDKPVLGPEAENFKYNKYLDLRELINDCLGIYCELTYDKPILSVDDEIEIKFTAICRSNLNLSVTNLSYNVFGKLIDEHDLGLIFDVQNDIFTKSFKIRLDSLNPYLSFPYPVYNRILGLPDTIWYFANSRVSYNLPEFRNAGYSNLMFSSNENFPLYSTVISNLVYKRIDPSYGELYSPVFSFSPELEKELGLIKAEIKYDHIPTQIYYKKKEEPLKFDYLKSTKIKVAYIPGAGDKIPEVLAQMGYDVTLLDESNFSTFELSNFTTIITGVRAYNTQSWLMQYNDKLLKYAEAGGNLVIQYNTSRGLVADIPKPYPFELSRDRVTEEEAEVSLLKKDHPLLKYPNLITTDDFKNWVQEFGLYFPDKVDERYEKILSMHDTGESPNENSLLYCAYGKGKYIYTGLSFFRELPAGVEGATKLFVNLIEKNEIEIKGVPDKEFEKYNDKEKKNKRRK